MPFAYFEVDCDHVLEQFMLRFARYADVADRVVSGVMETLGASTPHDWRFTESPSSRFFIVDEETEAKFMGMSYRDAGRDLVEDLQHNVHDTRVLLSRLASYVDRYLEEVFRPDLPIIHNIRTVYSRSGDLAEEKRIVTQTRAGIDHLFPLAVKKIASRPNAIVSGDGVLWVRQYMNWVSMRQGGREYYLFQPLTRNGVDKGMYAVFSHADNGALRKIGEKRFQCMEGFGDLSDIKAEIMGEAGIRSDNYWKVPTYLDRRLSDLDYLERYSEKGADFSSPLLVELYFLRKIVTKARERLHKG